MGTNGSIKHLAGFWFWKKIKGLQSEMHIFWVIPIFFLIWYLPIHQYCLSEYDFAMYRGWHSHKLKSRLHFVFLSLLWHWISNRQNSSYLDSKEHSQQCGNHRNLLSLFLNKTFVKVTSLWKKLLNNMWFHEIFSIWE